MIRAVRETGSTNADMLVLARDGADEGLWLRAERQTSGRGRLGRYWESESGNLHCSGLVRLRAGDPSPASLALVAGVATYQAILSYLPGSDRLMLKWPNDILFDDAKLCGMLLERAGDAIVVGVGINVTGHPHGLDRAVTSLWSIGGTSCSAVELMEVLADRFAHWLNIWRDGDLLQVRDQWCACAHPVGTQLRASLPDGTCIKGQFAGLEPDGALKLRLADGSIHVIHAGDIFLTGND